MRSARARGRSSSTRCDVIRTKRLLTERLLTEHLLTERLLTTLVLACGIAAAGILASPVWAQTACGPGDVEVRRVRFVGNRAFRDDELENAIVTTPSSWTRRVFHVFGTRRCLDRDEFPRDRLRLIIFYRNHGFARVAVDTAVRTLRPGLVDVTFGTREGPPTLIDSLTVAGLDAVDAPDRTRLAKDLPVRVGGRFDKYGIEATRDTLRLRLRNDGYPFADVARDYTSDSIRRVATVRFTAVTGPRTRLGRIVIAVAPRTPTGHQQIPDNIVRRLIRVRSGDLFRLKDLATAQRALYQTEDYDHVAIGLIADTAHRSSASRPSAIAVADSGTRGDSASSRAGDSTHADSVRPDTAVDLGVQLAEGYMHAARVGAGWGTLDCFRTQAQYTDHNFLHQAREIRLNGTVTKIGIGYPFNFAPGLCPQARTDLYSDTLNYGLSAAFRSPLLFGVPLAPTVTLFSARQSEFNAYVRSTPIGGTATLTRQLSRVVTFTPGYRLEYGKTTAQPAFFCVVFSLCSQDDQARAQQARRLAVVSATLVRDGRSDFENPDRGSLASLELRHASPLIGSDPQLQFNKGVGDVAWYLPAGGGGVIAARLRVGAVVGARVGGLNLFIPPEERLYAGGPTTVRGFPQNELGPVAYLPNAVTKVPVSRGSPDGLYVADRSRGEHVIPEGGNSSVVANLEYRVRSPFLSRLLQWTVFYDGGEVWNDSTGGVRFTLRQLRWTPGLGLRAFSPIGPVRIDVGYDPYGRPMGPAYYNPPVPPRTQIANLYCVSPDVAPDDQLQTTTSPPCKSTYAPLPLSRFLQRLTLNLSIGQAF